MLYQLVLARLKRAFMRYFLAIIKDPVLINSAVYCGDAVKINGLSVYLLHADDMIFDIYGGERKNLYNHRILPRVTEQYEGSGYDGLNVRCKVILDAIVLEAASHVRQQYSNLYHFLLTFLQEQDSEVEIEIFNLIKGFPHIKVKDRDTHIIDILALIDHLKPLGMRGAMTINTDTVAYLEAEIVSTEDDIVALEKQCDFTKINDEQFKQLLVAANQAEETLVNELSSRQSLENYLALTQKSTNQKLSDARSKLLKSDGTIQKLSEENSSNTGGNVLTRNKFWFGVLALVCFLWITLLVVSLTSGVFAPLGAAGIAVSYKVMIGIVIGVIVSLSIGLPIFKIIRQKDKYSNQLSEKNKSLIKAFGDIESANRKERKCLDKLSIIDSLIKSNQSLTLNEHIQDNISPHITGKVLSDVSENYTSFSQNKSIFWYAREEKGSRDPIAQPLKVSDDREVDDSAASDQTNSPS